MIQCVSIDKIVVLLLLISCAHTAAQHILTTVQHVHTEAQHVHTEAQHVQPATYREVLPGKS